MNLSCYKTLVFDCDGVILDSNVLKTQAYYTTAISYGATHEQATALMDYHVRYGGISRYPKYELFLRDILHEPVTETAMRFLLDKFASEIHQGLLQCEIASGLEKLRHATSDARWMVVSGGDQAELRKLFVERGIAQLFDAGIFGSPDNKDQILARELGDLQNKSAANKHTDNQRPAIYFGDSRYDHEAASHAGLDFVFMCKWTEFAGWQDYCNANQLAVAEDIAVLGLN